MRNEIAWNAIHEETLKDWEEEKKILDLGSTKPCPQCEAIREVKLVHYGDKVTMKGREIEYNAISYQCSECNETFDTTETMNKNLKHIRAVYEILDQEVTR